MTKKRTKDINKVIDFCNEKIRRWEELLDSKDFPFDTQVYINQIGPTYIDSYKQVITFIKEGGDI